MKNIELIIQSRPLSINKAYRGRRFCTEEYKSWKAEVAWQLSKPQYATPLYARYDFYINNPNRCDVDNMVKTIQDSLVSSNIIWDDRNIQGIIAVKHKSDTEHIKITLSQTLNTLV